MHDAVQNLKEILAAEVEIHAELLNEAELKRQAIITGDISAMEAGLLREQAAIHKVEALEKRRAEVVCVLRDAFTLTEPVRLKAILAALPRALAAPLAKTHEELKAVVEKLRYRSRQNAELLKASMEHVDAFLRTITTEGAPRKGYNAKGKVQAGGLRLLDKSA